MRNVLCLALFAHFVVNDHHLVGVLDELVHGEGGVVRLTGEGKKKKRGKKRKTTAG